MIGDLEKTRLYQVIHRALPMAKQVALFYADDWQDLPAVTDERDFFTRLQKDLITLSGFLALLMGADKATSRLTLTTSALVGSVLFLINMTSSMPPIGYLTFGDRLMMLNYIGLVLVLMVNVKVLALSEAGATTIAGSILDKAKYWFIGLFVLAHVVHACLMS